jgi:hypothetical protein
MRDLSILLAAGFEHKIPILISSAGGDGSNAHVDAFVDMASEISKANGLRLRTVAIYSEIDKPLIKQRMAEGRIRPLGPVRALSESEVDAATTVVAQMGAEPFLRAFQDHGELDLIIAGRAYDPAPTAAMGIRHGFDPALSWHMGKIMECGALCAEPTGRSIMGYLHANDFELEPLNPAERCTPASVAAHTLYEKSHPFHLYGPGGMLSLGSCTYSAVSDRRVQVSGSIFVPETRYTIKLEGAKRLGFRSIAIQGSRDSAFIEHVEQVTSQAVSTLRQFFPDVEESAYQVNFHIYGKNGVMGALEPIKDTQPKEICLITEVASATQELASAICGKLRTEMLHAPYPGRIATAGNLASPFTPLEIPLGEVCAFNIYHLMEVDSPVDHFPIHYVEI